MKQFIEAQLRAFDERLTGRTPFLTEGDRLAVVRLGFGQVSPWPTFRMIRKPAISPAPVSSNWCCWVGSDSTITIPRNAFGVSLLDTIVTRSSRYR